MTQFYEFFAGGGMARAGLGPDWQCTFANDIDVKKAKTYQRNWQEPSLLIEDIQNITAAQLPGLADLAWASFPCQDLSLAGAGAGLKGARSGTFWSFWALMRQLKQDGRLPKMIAIENVCGTLSSHQGQDFIAICQALGEAGYRFGALILDAAMFLPQSRPRLFILAIDERRALPKSLILDLPSPRFHTNPLQKAVKKLPEPSKKRWLWWHLPQPASRTLTITDLIEDQPSGVKWHTPSETQRILSLMSEANLQKVASSQAQGRRIVGAVYKRTRKDHAGRSVQRAEVRFDGIAGCLRTPVGGSSRQMIMVVEGEHVKSRLVSPRETARLMGLPDTYVLPEKNNEAYHLTGDGVVVPVVAHLRQHLFDPILRFDRISEQKEVA